MPYPKNRKSRITDIAGKKYNRLTAVRFDRIDNNRAFWLFKCECGEEKVIAASDVRSGHTKSCGCLFKEWGGKNLITHGLFKEYKAEFRIWCDMGYHNYGGRGINVCQEWYKFENFISDMGARPTPLHTIERNNNDEGYCKENCSWELKEVQANNTRVCIKIEWSGKIKTISQWAKEIGVAHHTLYKRIAISKWPLEKALLPLKYKSNGKTYC